VMSGTASIGMRTRDHKPRADAIKQASTTSHRRRIENSMMRLIMAPSLGARLRPCPARP
jgi:hypothetical protein